MYGFGPGELSVVLGEFQKCGDILQWGTFGAPGNSNYVHMQARGGAVLMEPARILPPDPGAQQGSVRGPAHACADSPPPPPLSQAESLGAPCRSRAAPLLTATALRPALLPISVLSTKTGSGRSVRCCGRASS